MKPVLFSIAAIIMMAVSLLGYGYIANFRLTPEDAEFVARIEGAFEHASVLQVSELMTGNWAEVCPLHPHDRLSLMASRQLKIPEDQLIVEGDRSVVATDDVWGLVFYYPPNKVAYYKITSAHFYPGYGDCAQRESAVFTRKHASSDDFYLITSQH